MQQILWETVFQKQFREILEFYGLDPSDQTKVEALLKQLNLTRSSSCNLMVEVDDHWKDKLINILGNKKS